MMLMFMANMPANLRQNLKNFSSCLGGNYDINRYFSRNKTATSILRRSGIRGVGGHTSSVPMWVGQKIQAVG